MEREFKAGDRVRIVSINPEADKFYDVGDEGVLDSKYDPETKQNHWWVIFDKGEVWYAPVHEFESVYDELDLLREWYANCPKAPSDFYSGFNDQMIELQGQINELQQRVNHE